MGGRLRGSGGAWENAVGNAGGVPLLAGREQEPRFLHGAIAIPLADFPAVFVGKSVPIHEICSDFRKITIGVYLQAEFQAHHLIYLGIRPRERYPHTRRREMLIQQIQVVLKSCDNCANVCAFPILDCRRHHPIGIPDPRSTRRLSTVPFNIYPLHKNSVHPRWLPVYRNIDSVILDSRMGLIIIVRDGTDNVRRVAMLADPGTLFIVVHACFKKQGIVQ